MASWNSVTLEVLSSVLGWIAFAAWSISFYPQVILNFRRKSVVGLNFDFVVLNLTKHSSYLIYNASLFFSSIVQRQYREKYGFNQVNSESHKLKKVAYRIGAANDVAFSAHAVLLTAFTLFQIAIYERGNQKVSKTSIAIVSVAWLSAAVCVFIALPSHSWLWLVSCFNTLQVVMTVIKYIPQAVMNFQRKSTVGFSIGNILLDLLGGVTNYGQMAVQSIDQNSWVNFYGNIGKTLLSLVSIFFDLLFILQHYVLYPAKKADPSPTPDTMLGVSVGLWVREMMEGKSRIDTYGGLATVMRADTNQCPWEDLDISFKELDELSSLSFFQVCTSEKETIRAWLIQFIAYQVLYDLSLEVPPDVLQDFSFFLNQLHLFHSSFSRDRSEAALFGRYLIFKSVSPPRSVANLMTWCRVEATYFILCN
ncbi:PQ-loop repeat family protein [Actinidia rufa]|uniref:Cystinosin homolog n=1 Tax=Actinidia rufa TaxID=165716 RepID=A0A7J0ELM2_9ERIC|nr:PQ-loop repeat family protein [Actinidia rufa]